MLLPTHEQAWLFAVARQQFPRVGLAVAKAEAFEQVESKLSFARLCDNVGLHQPRWAEVRSVSDLVEWRYPYYLKAPFSTAGRGVALVRDTAERDRAFEQFTSAGRPIMVQEVADGAYSQVAALFAHGRLVALHTSRQIGIGAGGSAAAREGTSDTAAQADVERLGSTLGWHGGLTLDYLASGDRRSYIECNPRTVEPGNAAASGVNLSQIQVEISLDRTITPTPRVGRPGVRTHGTMALAIGAAEQTRRRRAVLLAVGRALADRGSREVLTPLISDPPSVIPLAVAVVRVLVQPDAAAALAASAVSAYAVGPDAIATVVRAP